MDKLGHNKKKFFSDRLVIMGFVVICMYSVLVLKFYKLQVVDHEKYEQDLRASVERTVEVPAVRGIIYDRYGKPLATNKPVYVLKVDPQVTKINDSLVFTKDMLNLVLLNVANLLEANGDTYTDNIPISKAEPFVFTENESAIRSFITNYLPYDDQEHKEELYKLSATELMAYITGEDVFNIKDEIKVTRGGETEVYTVTKEDARKIVAMRLEMYRTAYQKYKKITIAENISTETLAAIEENKEKYPSIMAEVESRRFYLYGKEFGNVLGYTRKITASQYETMKEDGYDHDDIIGQGGIESSMESELRGQKGEKVIEVDNVGREVSTIKETDNKVGNDVYLTLDANLQLAAYNALEKRLSEAIVQRLKGGLRGLVSLSGREILVSMIENNQLYLPDMSKAEESMMQRKLYDKVNASYNERLKEIAFEEVNVPEEEKTKLTLKQYFMELLEADGSPITNQELLLALSEQGSLKLSESLVARIRSGNYPSVESILITELEEGRLKPDQMAIKPFSGSAVVVDVKTGDTLAVVGYPSFDSNEMTQNFNRYYTLFNDGIDSRDLLWNRATRTTMAPGSTFKMLTGIAGLEEGVVDAQTIINDTGVYTRAGSPYPNCWIFTNNGYGHGATNMERALEVSCNFYFYDVAYRLGLKYGLPYGGIDALSKYVEMFGLGDKTGIELEEQAPNVSNPANIVTTNTENALSTLRRMSEGRKKDLYDQLMVQLENGFYTYGSSKSVDIEGRIDYLTQYEMKRALDSEMATALHEDFDNIYNRIISDLQEGLQDAVGDEVERVVEAVFSDDSEYSLKEKTKIANKNVLKPYIKDSTRRAILKSLKKMPQDLVMDAYKSAYTNALARAEKQGVQEEILTALNEKLSSIEKGTFDGYSLLLAKVEDRILSTYFDTYFASADITWTTAITIRTAIGQGNNAFSPIQIARYIAGLANGKEVYDLKAINGIYDHKKSGQYVETPIKLYNTLDLKPSTLQSIYSGMRRVINGSEGTARNYFSGFEVEVAGKTGTAQGQGGDEHAWFVGFAPYDDPQIAVVTSMYSANGLGASNSSLARDIFAAYFKTGQQEEQITLDNQLVE